MNELFQFGWDNIRTTLYISYLMAMIVLSATIMLENRNPTSTIAYLLTLIFIPVFGLLIYLIFGQNFRKKRIFSRKIQQDNSLLNQWEYDHLTEFGALSNSGLMGLSEKFHIAKLLVGNSRSVITSKNDAVVFHDGDNAFEAIFSAIESARHHVHIDMYIIADDRIGRSFCELLMKKANSGVQVRLSYDDVGSGISRKTLRQLRASGVEVFPFMPVKFPVFTSKINYRNHKKIIVTDGKTGFIGGMNIADRYTNRYSEMRFWRDTQLKIEGEAVRSLQIQFLLNWRFVSGQALLNRAEFFPELQSSGNRIIQIAESGPDSPWSNIMQGIFSAIGGAREYIYIQTPYFIPNDAILLALECAALSGIKVKIMIPEKGDSRITHAATYSYIKPMLEAGAEVYLYRKGMLHAKNVMIDDGLSIVGTANMDQRSFDLNFEINAFLFDVELTQQLVKQFDSDLEHCRKLELDRWMKRRLFKRFTESMARIFAPLL